MERIVAGIKNIIYLCRRKSGCGQHENATAPGREPGENPGQSRCCMPHFNIDGMHAACERPCMMVEGTNALKPTATAPRAWEGVRKWR